MLTKIIPRNNSISLNRVNYIGNEAQWNNLE